MLNYRKRELFYNCVANFISIIVLFVLSHSKVDLITGQTAVITGIAIFCSCLLVSILIETYTISESCKTQFELIGKNNKSQFDDIQSSVDRVITEVERESQDLLRLAQVLCSALNLTDAEGRSIKLRTTSPYISRYFVNAILELRDVANGEVKLQRHQPELLWEEHVNNLAIATAETDVSATCVIPADVEKALELMRNDTFNDYCKKSYSMAKSQGIKSLRKLFLIPSKDTLRLEPVLEHLHTINEAVNSSPSISAKVLELSEVPRYLQKVPTNIDFILWGKEMVAISDLQETQLVHSLTLSIEKSEINSRRLIFDKLFTCPAARDVKAVLS